MSRKFKNQKALTRKLDSLKQNDRRSSEFKRVIFYEFSIQLEYQWGVWERKDIYPQKRFTYQ